MKTSYTPYEAQAALQVTPAQWALLVQKYRVEAQAQPPHPTALTYTASDVERLRFALNGRHGPVITLVNADDAPEFGERFCRMLQEENGGSLAVVTVGPTSGLDQLEALAPRREVEASQQRYSLPPTAQPPPRRARRRAR